MSPLVWVGVLLIGGVGAVARLLVDGAVSVRVGRVFPFGTLIVNLSGAFLLGLVTALGLSPVAALLVGTAAIGAYTTFSTWMFETQRLGENRQVGGLAVNIVASLVLGIAVAALGRVVGAHL